MTHTKTAVRTKLCRLYVPRSEDFKVYLDDNASKKNFPEKLTCAQISLLEIFHDVSDLFRKRPLRMSKVIGDPHRLGFVPHNFGLFLFHCYFGALYSINIKEVV